MKIEIDCNPSTADSDVLSQGIMNFNKLMIQDLEPMEAEKRFYVFARDDDGEVCGGIRATCYWNTLHIELLWLAEKARGGGAGRALIHRAEEYAREHDCANALVETTSWQAKPFYEKNGYKHMATLEGRPKGQASHYLSKTLA
ncbi:GNAT family N-acetyltransferase [Pacificimonas sp. WHA3]|uniref:GNAT family N-acetyltransferase n=1 Tax=Pacificimonas pallii TaxID=2827236 RepID=A0ABS6SEW1_9SPHN|nr:GNAT family N-acetyltransferase [Pacificimonas pallii]MBV7256471.1 GNAT family N-acetyltransferase [Pacificimonas pallii]